MRGSSKRISIILILIISYRYAVAQQDTTILIYFGNNRSQADSLQLIELTHFLNSVEAVRQVTGYADSVGSGSYNLNLSRLRAEYIANIIRSHQREKFTLRYLGEDHGRGSELKLNRRVEIVGSLRDKPEMLPGSRPATEEDKVIKIIPGDNIYFLPDKAIITEESVDYVKDLARILSGYKTNHFEIVGHVNYQSKSDATQLGDLYELSLQRAKIVYDLLVEYGIPKERLAYRGAGNSEPIIRNPKNDEEKRKNMRVEAIIR